MVATNFASRSAFNFALEQFQTDNHSKISHNGYVGLSNYEQNTIWFYFNSFYCKIFIFIKFALHYE